MPVAVTGASGHLGRKVAELLLTRLDPGNVVLLTRAPDALGPFAERGAVVRRADFDDAGSLADGLAGVERMLLISAVDFGRRVDQHRAAIDAARAAGVRQVVYTSIPNPERSPAAAAPSHFATEELLRSSGLAWTFLRNNLYAESQAPVLAQASERGRLVTNAGEGRVAYVSRDDCAAVAAAVLARDGDGGRAYDVTGPDAVGAMDLAALAAERGGRPVEVVQVSDEEWVAQLVEDGTPEPVARIMVSFPAAAREGLLGTVSSAVEDLTGMPPRALCDVVATLLPGVETD